MKNYLEVSVLVLPHREPDTYTVRVDSSVAGTTAYKLKLPFTLEQLIGILPGITTARGQAMPSAARATSGMNERDVGEKMFDALFQGEGRDVLVATKAHADAETARGNDTGVRVRITMNPYDSGMEDVAQLPWELMCEAKKTPFVISDKTPLVRSFDVLHPAVSRPFDGTLNILVVMSNPNDTTRLKLIAERNQIEQSLKPANVSVDYVAPSRKAIGNQLGEKDYHVVHFMGHGDFDSKTGGVLLLESADGKGNPDRLTGEDFATMLATEPLRLVYLNACKTGQTGEADDQHAPGTRHPFSGVASALIKQGVPAVIAMQFPISDTAAINFATTFYTRIAQQFPVEAAMAQARSALYTDDIPEWMTPVLYMRSRDGVLFTSPVAAQPIPASAAPVAEASAIAAADAPRIFLAATCPALQQLHSRLAADLRAAGKIVIDSIPDLPSDAVARAEAIRAIVDRADLCVHLMGDEPGDDLKEPGALRTMPMEQLRVALESAHAQIVVIPDLDTAAIENTAYREYLKSLSARSYEASRFELIRTGRLEVMPAIDANLTRQQEARSATPALRSGAAPVRTAFVDAHELDQDCANALVDFLGDHQVEAFMQTSEGPAEEMLAQLAENLKSYPLYILVAGKADEAWVRERTKSARSAAAKARAEILIGKYDGAVDDISMSRLKIIAAFKRTPPSPIESMFAPPPERKP